MSDTVDVAYLSAFHIGYPKDKAVHVALRAVRLWLDMQQAEGEVRAALLLYAFVNITLQYF